MNLNLICEETKNGININFTSIFTFIGIAFCVIVALVALVWLTCFIVKLLSKTFKAQINNSYDVFIENNNAKAKSKKQRNEIKRKAYDERKMAILNRKLESQERIHKMKLDKLESKLHKKEEKAREKYSIEKPAENKTSKKASKEQEVSEKVIENENPKKGKVKEEIKKDSAKVEKTKKTKTKENA